MGLTCGKYSIKIIFDIKMEICIFEISNVPNFNKFGTNLGLKVGKYFIKMIFDIKIKIGISEILIRSSFNKF